MLRAKAVVSYPPLHRRPTECRRPPILVFADHPVAEVLMMNRRVFVVTLSNGLIAMPPSLRAQSRKSARIGWVGVWYSQSAGSLLLDAFRLGMRERGYVEGQNLTIDTRWLEGRSSPREEGAKATADLVGSKVEILVVQGPAIDGGESRGGVSPRGLRL